MTSEKINDNTRFKKLIENSFSGLSLLDEKLQTIYRSPSAERINGWSATERNEKLLENLTHPSDQEMIRNVMQKVLLGPNVSESCTFRAKHAQGHFIWLECTFTNMFHEPSINAIVCNFIDVTEKKNADELLQQTIRELSAYKYALDESSIVAITDYKGIIQHVNENFCKISKYSRDELIGKDHRIINSSYHDKTFIGDLWKTIANGKIWRGELKNKSKDGNYYWVDTTIVPFLNERGKPYQYIAIRSDITNRKLSEEKIIESEHFIKTITDNLPAMITYWTADLHCLFANKPYLDWFDKKPDEILGIHKKDLLDKDEFVLYEPYILKVLSGEAQSFERTFLEKDGKPFFTQTRYLPDKENSTVKGFYSLIYDISEIKIAEKEVRKQTQQIEYLLESITDGFIGLDQEMCYTYANKQIGNMLGVDVENLIGKNIWKLFPEALGSSTYNAIQTAFRDKKFMINEDYYPPLNLWYENRIYPAGGGLSIFIRDISRQKTEELRLKLLESVIINTSDAILITESEPLDEPGPRIIYVNEAFTKMTGYTVEELIGKTPRILQGSKSDKNELKRLSEAIHNSQSCEITTINYRKNGEEFWMNLSVSPVVDEKGNNTHFIGIEKDITQIKNEQLQKFLLSEAITESLKERNTILESIGDAFFAVDKNWIVTYWNKTAENVLGKTKVEMIDHNLWDVFSESTDSLSYKKYLQAVETNEAVHFEDYYPPLDKWYEIGAYPTGNGLSVYFKDITDRKTVEIQLKELNLYLEKRTKELAVSNAELEQFAYVASHDLQEPLRMVTSFLTQIEKKYESILDEKGKQYINFAVDGAKRMRQIILDLLEFSRIGRIEEKIEEVDLNKIIYDIIPLYRNQIKEHNARILFDDLPIIQTLKVPIRQVFQNLISNSLKYQKKGERPLIEIACNEAEENWKFSVRDNGIGIDPEYFDKIFVIFQRLHNRDEFSGTGMGLAVTKKIIENLGGKIWVVSEEGKGSTFYFTILKN